MIETYASHFCGVGGACRGIHDAGLQCVLAIDNWQKALDVRETNLGHKGTCMDVFSYVPDKTHAADLLWTSPVCQTFSASSREFYGVADNHQERDDLYLASVNYVKMFKPKYFILENVLDLITHRIDHIGGGTFGKIKSAFKDIGYHVEWGVLDAYDWGMPQYRERIFIVGSIDGKKGLIPRRPVQKILPTLACILESGITKSAWGDKTYKTAMNKVERTAVSMRVMLPEDVFPTVTCGWGGGPTRKKVCIVDHAIDGTAFLRNPTIKEASLAQGFPLDWKWPENDSLAWKMVGNAVPPPMAKALVDHLKLVDAGKRPPSAPAYGSKNSEPPRRGKKIPNYVAQIAEDQPPGIQFD